MLASNNSYGGIPEEILVVSRCMLRNRYLISANNQLTALSSDHVHSPMHTHTLHTQIHYRHRALSKNSEVTTFNGSTQECTTIVVLLRSFVHVVHHELTPINAVFTCIAPADHEISSTRTFSKHYA